MFKLNVSAQRILPVQKAIEIETLEKSLEECFDTAMNLDDDDCLSNLSRQSSLIVYIDGVVYMDEEECSNEVEV